MTTADRQPAEGDKLLLEYVRDRDAPCPLCGYNLRDLSTPTCPECREELSLTVGSRKPRFGWLLVTVTPGIFSGISAALLLIPLIISTFSRNGPVQWPLWSVDAFGWLSGLAALVLVRYRYAFLRQPQAAQRVRAAIVWAIHFAALAVFITAVVLFL
jgi:hypothetical protein